MGVLLPLKMTLLIALLTAISLLAPCYADDNPDKKLRVVVFGGHPDDPESGAGGLIATLTDQGHEVICATVPRSGVIDAFSGDPKQRSARRRLPPPAKSSVPNQSSSLMPTRNWLPMRLP